MIQVENLTKIYKSSKKEKCIALNNVSFTLDDNGFVFVVGKSGSGKTTLLSIVGGLEEMTSGNITVDGTSLASRKNSDFVDYRNSTVGYVFQDFHLIDELTIAQNVAVSLQLQGVSVTDDAVAKVLADVDLDGYQNRYPKELSGGEKQRVAIARALVKNPSIILADEPTGNLDGKTTTQILTLLKRLSQNRLVMIVSHNLNDAAEYADRIIELSHGQIVSDYVRNPNYCENVTVQNGCLILPLRKKIDQAESEKINNSLKRGEITQIVQTDNAFIPNARPQTPGQTVAKQQKSHKHISLKSATNLSFRFIKKDLFRLLAYALITACLIVILGLRELIVTFDASKIIQKELNLADQKVLSLGKNELVDEHITVNPNCIFNIEQEEIDQFYADVYQGNIYKLVNVALAYGKKSLADTNQIASFLPNEMYYSGTRGTLVTTEDYIKNIFGDIQYLALADKIEDGGIYITDYTADAMIFYSPKLYSNYQSLLGVVKSVGGYGYAYVNGIIYTGYKDKYSDYITTLMDVNLSKDDLLEITSTEQYRVYHDDVIQNLSISYTTNQNFVADFLELCPKTWVYVGNSSFVYGGEKYKWSSWVNNIKAQSTYTIDDGEILMGADVYNNIFGTNYTQSTISQFVSHDVKFEYSYYYDTNQTNIVKTYNAKIKLIPGGAVYVAEDLFKQMLATDVFTSGLYFDDLSNVSTVMQTADQNGFFANSVGAMSLATMTKAVAVFSDFFAIIFVGLCFCIFFIIANYGIKLVKERKYEIGVLKALGIREVDLTYILGLQIVLLAICTIVLYLLGSVVFIDFANTVLIKSLLELAPNNFVMDIKVLYVNPTHFLINGVLTCLIVVVSFVAPLVKLKNLKPANIIKAKE